MPRLYIQKGNSGQIKVSFLYDPFLVEKIKTIPGYCWHPEWRDGSFQNTDGILNLKYVQE